MPCPLPCGDHSGAWRFLFTTRSRFGCRGYGRSDRKRCRHQLPGSRRVAPTRSRSPAAWSFGRPLVRRPATPSCTLGPSHTSADEETNFRAAQNTDAAVATAWSARSIQAQKAAAFICVKHHPRIGAAHLAGRLSRKAAIPCSASGPSQASARRRIVSSMTSASMRGPRSRASFLAAATAPGGT